MTTGSAPILEVRDVEKRFGGLLALQAVHLQVQPRTIHAVIGPNGAGKTTLFHCITGVHRPTKGSIQLHGEEINGLLPHRIARRGVARTFQNVRTFGQMTVLENVMVGAHKQADVGFVRPFVCNPFRPLPSETQCRTRALELLALFGMDQLAHRPAGKLPLADQRKLEMARALAAEPLVLLLDEPMAGMNAGEKSEMIELIRQVASRGTTVVLIEHDMRAVMSLASTITVLSFGKVIAEGTPSQVQSDPTVVEAYLGTEEE